MKMKKIVLSCLLACGFSAMSQSYQLQMGINTFLEKKYDEAIPFFNKELQLHPKEGRAYYYLAKIHLTKDENVEGLKKIDLAIANLADADTVLAKAWITKGDIFQQINDTARFESAYLKALKLFPALPEVYLERASSYMSWRMYEKAKVDLFKVLELDQTHLEARSLLCNLYVEEKKYDAIIKEANKMIALDPNYVDSYDFRAMAYFYLKKYDLAIQDAYTALTLNDRVARLKFNYLVYAKKNFGLALAKISSIINEYPQNDNWYLLRSQIYAEKRDFDKALQDFERILTLVSVNIYPHFFAKRAEVYSKMGLYKKAIGDYTGAIESDSADWESIAARGNAYRLLGKYDLAIADFDRAIELYPESADYYLFRGWAKEDLPGESAASLADYTTAIELDRELSIAYLHRGRLYQKSYQDTIRANADFRRVIELDTMTGSERNSRQFALARLGKVHEAKTWMSKILSEYPEDGNYYDAACLYALLNSPKESVAYLDSSFQKGYRDFIHLATDNDLDLVRNLPEFKNVVSQWKAKFGAKMEPSAVIRPLESTISGTYVIPFKVDRGGTFEVASKVNGLPLKMLFDTGAGDITISQTEVDFMIKNGYLNEKDFTGKARYTLANGEALIAKTVLLKKVELGGLVLENVAAAVVENREAGMLFGQSAMGRYATITIDNKKKQLIITGNKK